MADFGEI